MQAPASGDGSGGNGAWIGSPGPRMGSVFSSPQMGSVGSSTGFPFFMFFLID
jgi:hypothetical protein